jgi:hypothetical protein
MLIDHDSTSVSGIRGWPDSAWIIVCRLCQDVNMLSTKRPRPHSRVSKDSTGAV